MNRYPSRIALGLALWCPVAMYGQFSELEVIYEENFDSFPNGTPLTSLPGWQYVPTWSRDGWTQPDRQYDAYVENGALRVNLAPDGLTGPEGTVAEFDPSILLRFDRTIPLGTVVEIEYTFTVPEKNVNVGGANPPDLLVSGNPRSWFGVAGLANDSAAFILLDGNYEVFSTGKDIFGNENDDTGFIFGFDTSRRWYGFEFDKNTKIVARVVPYWYNPDGFDPDAPEGFSIPVNHRFYQSFKFEGDGATNVWFQPAKYPGNSTSRGNGIAQSASFDAISFWHHNVNSTDIPKASYILYDNFKITIIRKPTYVKLDFDKDGIHFQTEVGKRYFLECATNLGNRAIFALIETNGNGVRDFANEYILGDGTVKTIPIVVEPEEDRSFYRVRVEDGDVPNINF